MTFETDSITPVSKVERLRHRGCSNSLKVAQLGNGDRGLEVRQSDFRDPVLNHSAGSRTLDLTATMGT